MHVHHIRQTVLRTWANLEKSRCSAQSSVLFFRLSSNDFVSVLVGCFLILVKRFLPALRSRPCFPDYLVAYHCFQTLHFGPFSGQGMPKPKPQTPNPKPLSSFRARGAHTQIPYPKPQTLNFGPLSGQGVPCKLEEGRLANHGQPQGLPRMVQKLQVGSPQSSLSRRSAGACA